MRRKKVGVVEDNPDNCLLVHALLDDDYEIEDFSSGPDALAAWVRSAPDLILLDISLPGMDGLQVLERIRADEQLRHLPVVALTAHAMVGDRDRYLQAGFDDYLTKPILDASDLTSVIERLLGSPT